MYMLRTHPVLTLDTLSAPAGFAVADLLGVDEAFCCKMVEIELR